MAIKIVRDVKTEKQLQTLSNHQKFITQALIVLVVCAEVQTFLDGRISDVQDLGEVGVFDNDICEILHKKIKQKSKMSIEVLQKSLAFNIASLLNTLF